MMKSKRNFKKFLRKTKKIIFSLKAFTKINCLLDNKSNSYKSVEELNEKITYVLESNNDLLNQINEKI